jgi:signal peptidase I
MKAGRVGVVAVLVILIGLGVAMRFVPTPFVAVASDSMAPALQRGDLVLVGSVTEELDVGHVIVVHVPMAIQERYGYPPSIVHRIVEVKESADGQTAYRTKGDASAEDVFTTYPADVTGVVRDRIPYAGYPILFLHSSQGLFFLTATLFVYALYATSGPIESWLSRTKQSLSRALTADLTAQIQSAQQMQDARLSALDASVHAFAGAMREYAEHIRSHTAAVQAMAGAAQDIRNAFQERPTGPAGPDLQPARVDPPRATLAFPDATATAAAGAAHRTGVATEAPADPADEDDLLSKAIRRIVDREWDAPEIVQAGIRLKNKEDGSRPAVEDAPREVPDP